jgi:YesN/AraC family two-component response regulator
MDMLILLTDDHKVMRRGLRLLINEQADMEVVGEANNGHEAITLAQQLQPDVVVMDVSMPEMNGLKATEKLKGLCPEEKLGMKSRVDIVRYTMLQDWLQDT